jgi:hypothetical protein
MSIAPARDTLRRVMSALSEEFATRRSWGATGAGTNSDAPDSELFSPRLVTDLYEDEQQNARETRIHAQIMRDVLDKVNWQEIAEALRAE